MILDRRTLTMGMLAAATMPAFGRAKATVPCPDMAQWHIDTPPEREGMAPGPNGAVYYRVYGKPGGTPVVVLHGGPAAGEIYMRPYAGLATDRQVVLYDQTGCGRSARPDDLTRYTPDSYVSELEMLRDHLGFPQMAVLGHSGGGFLGPLYATAYPKRVKALFLAGSATSTQDAHRPAVGLQERLVHGAYRISERGDRHDIALLALGLKNAGPTGAERRSGRTP